MTAANSSMSTSRIILRPSGPPASSSRRSRRTRRRTTCSGIETRSTVSCSHGESHDGHPAGDHGSQSALAESLRGASHRLHPPRVPRPCPPERDSSLPASARLCRPTTTPRVPTKRSATTAPTPETSTPRQGAGSSPFLRSAGSITVTSASPDHPDRDPLVARLVLGPFTSPAAKIRAPTPNG